MSFLKELGQQFGTQKYDESPKENNQLEGITGDVQCQNSDSNQSDDISTLTIKPISPQKGIPNVSWIKINKIVYEKDTPFIDNLSTIYTALHETAKTVIMVIQKEKNSLIKLYLGVSDRSNVNNHISKYILQRAIGGCMPGIDFEEQPPHFVTDNKAFVASVSGQPVLKSDNKSKFEQGIEKLINSTSDMPTFTIVLLAENEPNDYISCLYDTLTKEYSALAEISETTITETETRTETNQTTNTKGTSNTDTKNESETINDSEAKSETQSSTESNSGGFGFFISGNQSNSQSTTLGITKTNGNSRTTGSSTAKGDTQSIAESKGDNVAKGDSKQKKIENKAIKEKLRTLGKKIEQLQQKDSHGIWSFSSYFITDTQTSAIVLASIYKGLIVGNQQAVDPYTINTWNVEQSKEIVKYLINCQHPQFVTIDDNVITPTVFVSTTELSIGMSLPQYSVPGILVKEQAKFGRNVLISGEQPQNVLRIGTVSHMGREEKKNQVFLDENQLTSHVFITGSTGSGKSNTIYTFLSNLKKEGKSFLIIEPAKGEYKKVLGGFEDVRVLGTNPQLMEQLKINPFSFPVGIHVEEHIDRLIDIFNACWPMYAAMPAVLKEAICRAYESCGWDLIQSKSNYEVFPTFDDVIRELNLYINESEYSSDSKGDYKGALGTRLESLTNGIIGQIFAGKPIEDNELFNKNIIIDLSRVGSVETKSLIMGLLIIKLNEFRMSENVGMNLPLRHITVLEEAHNLLRETSGGQSQETANVAGKSVEMLASAIAEMRTYGECFVIADQSPSLLDRAAISNTNTKIVMNLPNHSDREIVANSIGLTEQQTSELSKLKTGIAVIYQKGWEEPVQCLIARYKEMKPFVFRPTDQINESEKVFVTKLYTAYTDIPRFETLIDDIQSIGLSGQRMIKIINLLNNDNIEENELCAKIFVAYIGEKLFEKASKANNIADFNLIIEQGLKKIEGIDRNNVQTFLNMYVKGCSLMNKTSFYENWLMQNVKLNNKE